ncbi:hypothetical protein [Lactovum odontotermitis]
MKKGLAISLIGLAAAGTLVSAVSALADTYTGVSSGETEFVGTLGQIDPQVEDPDNNIPPAGDQDWVKVELPTRIAYWSDAATKHKTITSATHTVTNLSNYPVKVTLSGFTGADGVSAPDITGIKNLNLKSFKLVENAALQNIDPSTALSVKLIAGGNKPATDPNGALTGSKDWSLSVTGDVASTFTGTKTLNNKLIFTFKALDARGNEVTAP